MFKTRTGDQALVREINLSIILNALRDHSPASRAALAAVTGLNKTTVSSLVQQLIDGRFVSELGADKPEETGRPGILLELNPAAGCIIGAEIGVDFISVMATDFAVEIVWRHQEQTDPAAGPGRNHRARLHAVSRKRSGKPTAPVSADARPGAGRAGAGRCGLRHAALRAQSGLARRARCAQFLEAEFDFPVYVDNEANMAALGESYFGVARGAKSVLYVSAGVGLGGGIVLDGRIMPGAAGFVGEVGHMTVVLDGPPCNCGNRGCWETLVSQGAVFRRVRRALSSRAATRACWSTRTATPMPLTIPLVVEAARAGDRVALERWKKRACTWASASPTWSTRSTRKSSSSAAFSAWRRSLSCRLSSG